jgi:valyl-tRNA synthetase
MRTRDEVEALKQSWLEDPCFDLYGEEGFEEYRDELTNFAQEWTEKWRAEHEQKIKQQMFKLDCSYAMASYTLDLELSLNILKSKVRFLEYKLNYKGY